MDTYKIVRFYQDDRPREIIDRGLTLEQAQEHCRREDTQGDGWFDGHEKEDAGLDEDQAVLDGEHRRHGLRLVVTEED
jgi:hypothetical protein